MNFVHGSLNLIFVLSTGLIFIRGDKFIGKVLKSKLRNYKDHKLWMNYLEKRLQIISLNPMRKSQIVSIVHFYQINLEKDIFRRMYVLCAHEETTFLDVVQFDIFGSICASSKSGVEVDECMHLQGEKQKGICLRDLGKIKILFNHDLRIIFKYWFLWELRQGPLSYR